jgi:hypothetical protein
MLTIKVNDTDRTNYVPWRTFKKTDNLNSTTDTCFFSTRKYGSKTWKPEINDEVEVLDGEDTIFAGNIVNVQERTEGAKLIRYDVNCNDWTYLMDKKLVFDTYENQSFESVVQAIVSDYCPGFTATPIAETGLTVEYILFNYEQPSKCIQQLAEEIGYDWYIDTDKNVHFFSKTTGEEAPFDLTDTNGKYIFNSLNIKEDYSQLRNVIYVRGGEYIGSELADKIGEGDGKTKIFKLPYRYDEEPTITLSGSPQTVGVDYINDPEDYDCLWNYQEKLIKFSSTPESGDIEASGLPKIPVLVKASRGSSTDAYGDCEYVIVDKTITSKEAARQRAEAELLDYALPITEATFTTTESGLRSGQKINIQSDIRGIDEDFIINRVRTTCQTPTEGLYYEITASTSRPLGIVRFLQKQLESTNKKVGVFKQEGEVLDVIIDLEEVDSIAFTDSLTINNAEYIIDVKDIDSLSLSDSLLRTAIDSPPTWVLGSYCPTSDADRKRPIFLDRDCQLT